MSQIGRNKLFKEKRHRTYGKADILMTIAPNLTKSEPMETRHLEFSKDIKFEGTKARKGLQIVT